MISTRINKKHVYVESFYVNRTWGGMMEGGPDREIVTSMFNQVDVRKFWGEDRKVVKIKPESFPDNLPKYTIRVWLDDMDRHAFVILWTDMDLGKLSISEVLEEELKDTDWKELSEEYEF